MSTEVEKHLKDANAEIINLAAKILMKNAIAPAFVSIPRKNNITSLWLARSRCELILKRKKRCGLMGWEIISKAQKIPGFVCFNS